MILLIDLCYEKESLSRYEFVDPIVNVVKRADLSYEAVHFTELDGNEAERYDKVILCGTALKDNAYAEQMELFSWIEAFEKPLLGICTGMQVVGSVFGGDIVPRSAIGLDQINIVEETPLLGDCREIEGYHLHKYGITLPESFSIVAGTSDWIEAFKHSERPIYGILFHPEVRNRWIIERFAEL